MNRIVCTFCVLSLLSSSVFASHQERRRRYSHEKSHEKTEELTFNEIVRENRLLDRNKRALATVQVINDQDDQKDPDVVHHPYIVAPQKKAKGFLSLLCSCACSDTAAH